MTKREYERKVIQDYVHAAEFVPLDHGKGECRECDIRRAMIQAAQDVLDRWDEVDNPVMEWNSNAAHAIDQINDGYRRRN